MMEDNINTSNSNLVQPVEVDSSHQVSDQSVVTNTPSESISSNTKCTDSTGLQDHPIDKGNGVEFPVVNEDDSSNTESYETSAAEVRSSNNASSSSLDNTSDPSSSHASDEELSVSEESTDLPPNDASSRPAESSTANSIPLTQKFILVADVGSTIVRCHIYSKAAQLVSQAELKTKLIYPSAGAVELECDELWDKFLSVIKMALSDGDFNTADIACMGITTFRNSFVTWDRDTGKPFHNINMWQDKRTQAQTKAWNSSFTLAALKKGSGLLHSITGSQRFKAGYALKFMTQAVPLRLNWMINNTSKLKSRLKEKKVMFGTVDTWLLWKLSGERVWATDRASASGTLMYDTFQNMWSSMITGLVGIPMHILPPIVDTSGQIGVVDESIFGTEIPITGLVGDQQASLFGHCCFKPGDMKLTLGTGSFLNVNIGSKPLASITGIYPLVAWDIKKSITFTAEASSITVGTCIDWLKSTGIIQDVSSTSDIAKSVPDTNGCYFVPAFAGLPAPINDDTAGALLIGMTPTVTSAHIVRAVLESIAFVIKLQYETMVAESGHSVSHIRVDGGVSNNDFLLQCLADILQKPIHRPQTVNMTSRGAALLAGLGAGIWSCQSDLVALSPEAKIFKPQKNWHHYREVITEWERAVRRCKSWGKS